MAHYYILVRATRPNKNNLHLYKPRAAKFCTCAVCEFSLILFLNMQNMAQVSVLEEGSSTLKSSLKKMKLLFDRLYDEIFVTNKSLLLREGELAEMFRNRQGVYECHLATWCKPHVAEEFTPLK